MKRRKGIQNCMVHVYLSDEEKARVEKDAERLGISVSSYIKVKLFQAMQENQ